MNKTYKNKGDLDTLQDNCCDNKLYIYLHHVYINLIVCSFNLIHNKHSKRSKAVANNFWESG